ncbi:hypothetical protein [Jannaschia seosinensis]|uniref:hypothetical protein n=1 Tax=Jannaschia seosinensis TaxID=313367 RepID=UPI0016418D14|nr:hypothetical protein [Jannaschia seosinensis]
MPRRSAPAQLSEVLARLVTELPEFAGNIVYAGATLPSPEDLPATADLIAAHQSELARASASRWITPGHRRWRATRRRGCPGV